MSRDSNDSDLNDPDEGVSLGRSRIIRTTKEAVQVKCADRESLIWIPKSQIHANSEIWKQGDTGDFFVTEYIAEKDNLI